MATMINAFVFLASAVLLDLASHIWVMNTMENSLQQSCKYLPTFPPPKNTKPSYSRCVEIMLIHLFVKFN